MSMAEAPSSPSAARLLEGGVVLLLVALRLGVLSGASVVSPVSVLACMHARRHIMKDHL
jgi:hypothetical protein